MSIQSEDITNMLRQVMGGNNDDIEDEIIANIMVDVNNDENNVKIEELEDIDDNEDNEDNEDNADNEDQKSDDIIITNKKDDDLNSKTLLKKTNEELKNMLKAKALSTKGTKNELVERLLSNI